MEVYQLNNGEFNLARMEIKYITLALIQHKHNTIAEIGSLLGLNTRTFHRKMKMYNIDHKKIRKS